MTSTPESVSAEPNTTHLVLGGAIVGATLGRHRGWRGALAGAVAGSGFGYIVGTLSSPPTSAETAEEPVVVTVGGDADATADGSDTDAEDRPDEE